MAKDRKKLQHIHSSIPDKQPTAASLEVGEIAVNNAANQEFLSIKNSNNEVKRFSSDEQIVTIMEKKEVMPYSGAVDNIHLDTNRSNIEIKLNQVAAGNTIKHDVVNGARDIDGDLVNPTDDGGLTNGAGFAIDMSQYAMIGANPSFSSITVTHRSNLSGTTNISNGDGGDVLNITTTNVNADNSNWTETIDNKASEITTLDESIANRTTEVGTETLTVSGTTTETKKGDVTENNLANKVENTSSDYTVNTVGKNELNSTGNTCINSEVTASLYGKVKTNVGLNCSDAASAATTNVYGTTVNVSAPSENHNGDNLVVNESASAAINAPSAAVSGTNLVITEDSTVINSCGTVEITTNDFKLGQCSGGSGSAEFEFCGGYKVKSDKIELIQCSENGSFGVSSDTMVLSGETLNTTVTDDATVNIGGDFTENITGVTNVVRGGNVTETDKGNVTVNVSGTTTETKNGNVTENNLSNKTENTNGNLTISTVGTTNISSNDNVCISSQKDADFYGKNNTNVGIACDGSVTSTATVKSTDTVNVYSPTINESGTTNNNTFTTVNTTASTVNQSGNTYNVAATTNINGNTNITGNTVNNGNLTVTDKIYFTPDCTNKLTATTVNAAVCEVFDRSVITIEENHNPTDESLAAVYTFYQNGETVKDASGNTVQIEVAKDKVLKSAVVVQNTSGEWVIRLTWITYDPDTQTSTETTTDVPASELVKDIDFVNSDAIKGSIWYDSTSGNQKISADTTVQIVTDGNGTKTFSKSNAVHSLNSYKLTTAAGSFTAKEFDPLKESVTINVPTAISHIPTRGKLTVVHNGLNETFDPASDKQITLPHSALTWTYGATSGKSGSDSFDTSADKSINIPTDISHLNRGKLTISHCNTSETFDPSTDKTISFSHESLSYSHNGFSGTYDPCAGGTFSSPHSSLTATYEATSGKSGNVIFNTSVDKNISIPTCVNHLNRHKITFQSGSTASFNSQTYDPGKDCANSAETINIPTSLTHLKEWDGSCLTVPGCAKATNFYQTSDRNAKENIEDVNFGKIYTASKIHTMKFNFKDDPTHTDVYGVIAQDVEALGLTELVMVDENGKKSVDYTSLMMLKIAYLENENKSLMDKIIDLDRRLKKLER
jgi:hypothetical protein